MPISETLEAPQWIDSGAVMTGGLDLLGLRLSVQSIGGSLLDGITTVTPQVRYLAFRSWLIQQYGRTGRPDSSSEFTDFALRVESVLVLANLSHDRGIGGLIGADQAAIRLDANTPTVSIAPLVKSPASTIYAGPSDQLGITKTRDDAVPALIIERGAPLAKLVDDRLSAVPLVKRLINDSTLTDITLDELQELGAVARIDHIPNDERDALLASIIPTQPRRREIARVATYVALLTLANTLEACPAERDLFDAACSKRRFGEPTLDHVANGWLKYCIRDAIAVTQEAVLSAVMTEITTKPDDGRSGIESSAVIASLMERVEEHSAALRDLGVLSTSESVTDLSFRQLQERVEWKISHGIELHQGLLRWDSDLIETKLYQLSGRAGAGSLSLALVAWILAALRVDGAIYESGKDTSDLSYQGWRRMGLREVILPNLERFQREDRPVRDVVAELARRTVNQHLQIAWSRLQVDLRRDVALLTTESDKWCARGKGFGGGRTASRLSQAIGWLQQLRLIDANGITVDGEVVRQAGLRILAAEDAA